MRICKIYNSPWVRSCMLWNYFEDNDIQSNNYCYFLALWLWNFVLNFQNIRKIEVLSHRFQLYRRTCEKLRSHPDWRSWAKKQQCEERSGTCEVAKSWAVVPSGCPTALELQLVQDDIQLDTLSLGGRKPEHTITAFTYLKNVTQKLTTFPS